MNINLRDQVLFLPDTMSQIYTYLSDWEKAIIFPKVCKAWRQMSLLFDKHHIQINMLNRIKEKIHFYAPFPDCNRITDLQQKDQYWNKALNYVKEFNLISLLKSYPRKFYLSGGTCSCGPTNIIFSNMFIKTEEEFIYNVPNKLQCHPIKANSRNFTQYSPSFYMVWSDKSPEIHIDFEGNKGNWGDYRAKCYFSINRKFKKIWNIEFCKKITFSAETFFTVKKSGMCKWKDCEEEKSLEKHQILISSINIKLKGYILNQAQKNLSILSKSINDVSDLRGGLWCCGDRDGNVIENSKQKKTSYSWVLNALDCKGITQLTWQQENSCEMKEGAFRDFLRWAVITKTVKLLTNKLELFKYKESWQVNEFSHLSPF